MATLFKHHHIREYWERHIHGIAMFSGSLAIIALVIACCFALVIFSEMTVLLLQLLEWIGKDCLWCMITPS